LNVLIAIIVFVVTGLTGTTVTLCYNYCGGGQGESSSEILSI
jgi:hypothetical protein